MTTQTTELTFGQQLNKVQSLMLANRDKMLAALPRHITPDRMMRVALTCLRKNPRLLECTPASLLGAITEAATYGWELGGVLGHAYLVPYRDEAVMIPGYKGLLDLCHRSGQLADATPPAVVREGDQFDYELGDQPFIKHKPASDAQRLQKPITHAYWVVNLRGGGTVRLVKSIAEIRAHRDQYSQSYRRAERYRLECEDRGRPVDDQKLSAWHTAEPVMAGKTLIREAINRGLIPMSSEFRTLAGREHQAEIAEASTAVFSGEDLLPGSTAAESGGTAGGGTAPPHPASPAAAGPAAESGDVSSLLEQLEFELSQTDQLLDCRSIADQFLNRCTDNDQRLAVAAAVNRREDQIRASRGGQEVNQ